jgi:hypothetical protein
VEAFSYDSLYGATSEPRQTGGEAQIFRDRQHAIDRILLKNQSQHSPDLLPLSQNVVSKDSSSAPTRNQQRGENQHRCCLSGAVRTEKPHDLAWRQHKIERIERPNFSVVASEALGLDSWWRAAHTAAGSPAT